MSGWLSRKVSIVVGLGVAGAGALLVRGLTTQRSQLPQRGELTR